MIYLIVLWVAVWLYLSIKSFPKLYKETGNCCIPFVFNVGLLFVWPIALLIEFIYYVKDR